MKILLYWGYHPIDTTSYLEKAFAKDHQVTYCGPPFDFKRAGFAKDLDLSKVGDNWDLFFYVDSYHPGFPRGIERLSFPTVCYFLDVPYDIKQRLLMAPFFDYVFIANKNYLKPFKKINKNVFWLPFAADPETTYRDKSIKKIYDIGFVGGVKGTERGKILDKLSKQFKLNDYHRFYQPREMAKIYNQSKIVFNQSIVHTMNMRIFEAMASGSMLLTEEIKDGQDELFDNKKHLVTFEGEDDLVEKIKYYLAHDKERERIAAAGEKEVLAKHTYWHRAQTVLKIIKDNNYRMEAPARDWPKDKVFLAYTKIYSRLVMVDAVCDLFAHQKACFWYKLLALKNVCFAVCKRLRRMNWRIFIKSIFKYDN